MGASTKNRARFINPLDRVRMSESERRAAKAYLAQGEAVADFIMGVIAALRFVIRGVERGVRTLARTASAHH